MPLRTLMAIVFLLASACFAQTRTVPTRLLLVTQSAGFDHDVVKRKDGKPSVVEQTFDQLAKKTGLFTVEATRDASIVTPAKLKDVDIVAFYTTGDLPMKPQDLIDWVKQGGRFLGVHTATDTFLGNPVFHQLVGAEFAEHPWTSKSDVTIKVLDPEHPTAKPFVDGGRSFKEEIYHQKNVDLATMHVILGLDMEQTALKKPYFVPIAWCKPLGKGRSFCTELGHREDMWTNPRYQDHLVAAIEWLIGKSEGSAEPNPQIAKREEQIAQHAAATTQAARRKP